MFFCCKSNNKAFVKFFLHNIVTQLYIMKFLLDIRHLKNKRLMGLVAQLVVLSHLPDIQLSVMLNILLPIVSTTGMCRGNAPVLSHFTLNLPMYKASLTFIMPTKFIPCVMAMTFHDNSSKIFCKAMSKTDLSIKFRPWKSIICISIATEQITVQKILQKLLSKCPQNLDFSLLIFLSQCLYSCAFPVYCYHFRVTVILGQVY